MATYGLQVFSGLKETVIDPSTRVLRSVKSVYLSAGSAGSTTIPEFSINKGFFTAAPIGNKWGDRGSINPVYSISWDEGSKTLSWDMDDDAYNEFDTLVSFYHYA